MRDVRLNLPFRRSTSTAARVAMVAGVVISVLLPGCEVDSFLDPSVTGRWEKTPTTVPILERIASIEDESVEAVESTEATAEDLIPAPQAYRVGSGDAFKIELYDLIERNTKQDYDRQVDSRGMIELPQLGEVYVAGKTLEGAKAAVEEAMRKLVADPLVSLQLTQQRQQVYHLMGAVEKPGSYFIPSPDFRLLEGLTSAGRFSESIEDVYVIRQIPLSDALGRQSPEKATTPNQDRKSPIDLIDDLTNPVTRPVTPPGSAPTPGVLGSAAREPVIELPDSGSPASFRQPASGGMQPVATPPGGTDSSWVFIDGKWVQVVGSATSGAEAKAKAEDLLTQRIIKIPLKALLAGNMKYNVVLRPGDTVRIPSPPDGLVFMAGQVARQGPINLPTSGRLTLMRAIDSAGGLGQLAIPERVDLTRAVGRNRQAIIRLDLRAINEGTQPDIYLKPDDRINVGTNFWALPLATIRNGFRASYGFGFILDRNFGNDVFGAPPTNRFGE
ncbi:MAG: polysaccharide biosynthesis/export family protein [Planctomycetes bacterium]|nr:polysaccharide biosynthesis/export family protein [Planctomycetota bacterium]